MYATHFCLRHRPFRPTPDSSTYYPATSHERALAGLLQALKLTGVDATLHEVRVRYVRVQELALVRNIVDPTMIATWTRELADVFRHVARFARASACAAVTRVESTPAAFRSQPKTQKAMPSSSPCIRMQIILAGSVQPG